MKAQHHTMLRLLLNSLSEKGQNLLCSVIEMVNIFQGKTGMLFANAVAII